MLRDPVARAVSNWRFSTDHGLEKRPLEPALRDNLAAPAAWDPGATSVSPFAYLERGRYADHLRPWYDALPGDGVHVLFLEDLLDDDEAARDALRARSASTPASGPGAGPGQREQRAGSDAATPTSWTRCATTSPRATWR